MESAGKRNTVSICLAGLLLLEICGRFFLLFRLNIHWDEFHYLAQIYEFKRGALTASLQTFHVRFLSWLISIPGNEVWQIIIGRIVMLGVNLCVLVCFFVFLTRRFSYEAALFALLGYEAVSEVIIHGASFRSDPLLLLIFAGSLAWLTRRYSSLGTAFLFAFGALLNLKSVLFLGWFWLIAIFVERKNRRWWLEHSAAFVVITGAGFLLHRAGPLPSGVGGVSAHFADVGRGFLFSGWSEAGIKSLLASLAADSSLWAVACCGFYTALRARENRLLALLSLFGILLCFIYRNAWPYFLPLSFGLLPVLFAQMYGFLARLSGRILFIALFGATFGAHFWNLRFDEIRPERQVVQAVHFLFPEPVAYIDRCGMIASFPSTGPLLSSWVLERENHSGEPIFSKELLTSSRPRFLILNSPALLRPELEEYFVKYWGPVYLARDLATSGKFEEYRNALPPAPTEPLFRY